ncbi:hypothetical protein AAMO2058_001115900 [Amorphochlora amoebiformis]
MRAFSRVLGIARRTRGERWLSASVDGKGSLTIELEVLTTIMKAEKAKTVNDAFKYFADDALVIRPSGCPIEAHESDWTTAILGLWGLKDMTGSVHGVDRVQTVGDKKAIAYYTVDQTFMYQANETRSKSNFMADMVRDDTRGWVISRITRLG